MSLWKIYRYEDLVLAPRMVRTEAGVFLESEPVQMVRTDNREALRELLQELLSGAIEDASESDLYNEEGDRFSPQSVLLAALSLQRWQDFERKSLLFTMHKTDEKLDLHVTGRGDNGLWSLERSKCTSFPLSVDSQKLAALVADELIAAQAVPPPKLLGGPIAPRPSDSISEKKD